MSAALPEGFEDLAPFVADWAVAGAAARDALRGASPAEDRMAFHAAFSPRLAAALDRLDQTPLADHDEAENTLMLLALSFAHVAQAVEVQGPDETRHARCRARLPITRAPADT